jgi:uncharacterized protein YqeY
MTDGDTDSLRERLSRALPVAMKARDRVAVAALRSALAAIANAEAVDPSRSPPPAARSPDSGPSEESPDPRTGNQTPASSGPGPPGPRAGHQEPAGSGGDPPFAGTVAGIGATEMDRRSLTGEQVEEVVRAEIAERETAAAGYEHTGQMEHAERLRGEAKVLRSHLQQR